MRPTTQPYTPIILMSDEKVSRMSLQDKRLHLKASIQSIRIRSLFRGMLVAIDDETSAIASDEYDTTDPHSTGEENKDYQQKDSSMSKLSRRPLRKVSEERQARQAAHCHCVVRENDKPKLE
ncbi:hypothetical protein AC1031_021598 [Aphanomyces cochlioides]|nr:hypothetical protein AC1031_021598 [Aphanomyces cochlioides]